jgi:hypothetical protein
MCTAVLWLDSRTSQQHNASTEALLRTLEELGVWSAVSHFVLMLERMWQGDSAVYTADAARSTRVRYPIATTALHCVVQCTKLTLSLCITSCHALEEQRSLSHTCTSTTGLILAPKSCAKHDV